MDFNGTWKVYSEENIEEFLKVIGKNIFIFSAFVCVCMYTSHFKKCLQGAPEMVIKMRKDVKPVIVIEQNGKDFTCTMKTPICTKVHSFSIGKESEMTALDGKKLKVIQASNSSWILWAQEWGRDNCMWADGANI